jgi:hypothetical protein
MNVSMISGTTDRRPVAYRTEVVNQEFTLAAPAPQLILTPDGTKAYLMIFRNTSPAGQNFRVGSAPTFAPNKGALLAPGDVLILEQMCVSMSVITDAANGVISVNIYST